jgi:hypothetical protein
MSLVSFTLEAMKAEIVGGWDPLDREFVLYVFDLRGNAVTAMLWSNLCDYDPIDKTSTERLRERLEKYLGITPPAGFWERVERKEPERIRYEWVNGTWFKGLYRETTFQVPMFDEPSFEPFGEAPEITGVMTSLPRLDPLPDSDIEVNEEVTQIRSSYARRLGQVG